MDACTPIAVGTGSSLAFLGVLFCWDRHVLLVACCMLCCTQHGQFRNLQSSVLPEGALLYRLQTCVALRVAAALNLLPVGALLYRMQTCVAFRVAAALILLSGTPSGGCIVCATAGGCELVQGPR